MAAFITTSEDFERELEAQERRQLLTQIELYLEIVIAEYNKVHQAIQDLMQRNSALVPLNIRHAMEEEHKSLLDAISRSRISLHVLKVPEGSDGVIQLPLTTHVT